MPILDQRDVDCEAQVAPQFQIHYVENRTAFLTGSHAYGTPREDSDIDMCILVDPKEYSKLRKVAAKEMQKDTESKYEGETDIAFKFGNLNLLVFKHRDIFAAWRAATDQCKTEAPVTRERAVYVIDEMIQQVRDAIAEGREITSFDPVGFPAI